MKTNNRLGARMHLSIFATHSHSLDTNEDDICVRVITLESHERKLNSNK